MDMVDRVAAALMTAQAHGGNLGEQARAAIEAMRQPTEHMLIEGSCVDGKSSAAEIWGYMIEAAVGETKTDSANT